MKVAQLCLTLLPHGLCSPWKSLVQNTGVGSLSLLQGIFLLVYLKIRKCDASRFILSQNGFDYFGSSVALVVQ